MHVASHAVSMHACHRAEPAEPHVDARDQDSSYGGWWNMHAHTWLTVTAHGTTRTPVPNLTLSSQHAWPWTLQSCALQGGLRIPPPFFHGRTVRRPLHSSGHSDSQQIHASTGGLQRRISASNFVDTLYAVERFPSKNKLTVSHSHLRTSGQVDLNGHLPTFQN